MDIVIEANGIVRSVEPENGTDYTLIELKEFIGGGDIEIVPLGDELSLVCDENGQDMGLPVNSVANIVFGDRVNGFLLGDVLVCERERIN
jgi:hypothetical protein